MNGVHEVRIMTSRDSLYARRMIESVKNQDQMIRCTNAQIHPTPNQKLMGFDFPRVNNTKQGFQPHWE